MPLLTLTRSNYYRAATALVTGDVIIGEQSSLWFNAVIRGDEAPIRIGRRVNVQDHVLIHCGHRIPNIIEDDVTIGHGAIVHGAFVGQGSLIGMGAILLNNTRVGRGCLIAAGAVLSPGFEVPDGMVVMGVPGKIARAVDEKDREYLTWLTPHYIELAQAYVRGDYPEH